MKFSKILNAFGLAAYVTGGAAISVLWAMIAIRIIEDFDSYSFPSYFKILLVFSVLLGEMFFRYKRYEKIDFNFSINKARL